MADSLLSVGLDVGTTTTQLIVSRLSVENQATGFAVPKLEISNREILYRSPVYFTPLLDKDRVDGERLRNIVEREYGQAGIAPAQVETGAVIITGETSRKENAAAVLQALSGFAGDFVAATAGPDLESVLSAKGGGAVTFSEQTGKTVLHMDIGGGTSNLSWIENGKILRTGCLNVGGRLVKLEADKVCYVSPVLEGLTELKPGDRASKDALQKLAQQLAHALEMAAGLRPATDLLDKLWTKECGGIWTLPDTTENIVISFSGGVADCMQTDQTPGQFGDMGVELGQAIRSSLLCRGEYRIAEQAIRATVIGAGCHSAQLSGSTVFCRDVKLPLKNLPVAVVPKLTAEAIRENIRRFDQTQVVLALHDVAQNYDQLSRAAQSIAEGVPDGAVFVCLEQDLAKALGQKLALLLPDRPVLCIDRVQLTGESFLDVGAPIGPAFPVVVKTLVMNN